MISSPTIKIAHIYCSYIERSHYGKKIKSHVKHNLTSLSAFSLTHKAQRKRLSKKKRRFMGSAQTRKLLKKLDQNFPAWVQCEHLLLVSRAQNVI